MREKITIKSDGGTWKLTIPGFGFNPFVEIKFAKWSDAINYLDWRPQGSSSSFERAHQDRDAIAPKPEWSPLQW
jgi:hypothetical protein